MMVNHGKYHGILWNTIIYFHKGTQFRVMERLILG